jgi:hypothetical protein
LGSFIAYTFIDHPESVYCRPISGAAKSQSGAYPDVLNDGGTVK